MSLIVICPLVATGEVPVMLPAYTATVNFSITVSVVASANGVTINEPVPLTLPLGVLIVTVPLVAEKSAALLANRLLIAQFNVVPFTILVVVTLKVIGVPSLIEVAPFAAATA